MIAQDGNCCSKSSKQSLDRKERSPGDSCRQEEQKENEPEQNACSGGNREIRKPRVNRRQPDVRGAEETKFHTCSRSHLAPSRPGLSLRVLEAQYFHHLMVCRSPINGPSRAGSVTPYSPLLPPLGPRGRGDGFYYEEVLKPGNLSPLESRWS